MRWTGFPFCLCEDGHGPGQGNARFLAGCVCVCEVFAPTKAGVGALYVSLFYRGGVAVSGEQIASQDRKSAFLPVVLRTDNLEVDMTLMSFCNDLL